MQLNYLNMSNSRDNFIYKLVYSQFSKLKTYSHWKKWGIDVHSGFLYRVSFVI